MRWLANENFPAASIALLRAAGEDVAAVSEDAPGTPDLEVLARANQEARIILTFDRDYGELIYRRRLPAPLGVVYFRFAPQSPDEPFSRLMQVVTAIGSGLVGKFTVVEDHQIRQRPLP